MIDIQPILIGFYALTFLAFVVNFRIGVIFWMIATFLNPCNVTNIKYMSVTPTLMNMVLVASYFYHYRFSKIDMTPLKPLVVLYVILGIIMPLGASTPIDFQLRHYITQSLSYVIVPLLLFNFLLKAEVNIKFALTTILCIGMIAVIYGFFLPTFEGFNPYWNIMKPFDLAKDYEIDDGSRFHDDGRLFGRLSSVFTHPMVCGNFMILFLVLGMYLASENRKYILVPISTIVFISIAGVRSSFIAALISVVIVLYYKNKKSLFRMAPYFIGTTILLMIIPLPQQITDLITSVFSEKSTGVEGSSGSMRLIQLEGCFSEISGLPILFGKGFNWTDYYISHFGGHPIILAFESIVFVVLCNWGLVGSGFWICSWGKLFKVNRDHIYTKTLMITFLFYTTFTGLYDYMKFFSLFYMLLYYMETHAKSMTTQ